MPAGVREDIGLVFVAGYIYIHGSLPVSWLGRKWWSDTLFIRHYPSQLRRTTRVRSTPVGRVLCGPPHSCGLVSLSVSPENTLQRFWKMEEPDPSPIELSPLIGIFNHECNLHKNIKIKHVFAPHLKINFSYLRYNRKRNGMWNLLHTFNFNCWNLQVCPLPIEFEGS